MKSKKKFLAIVLAVVMCLSILPMSAFAAEPEKKEFVYVTLVDKLHIVAGKDKANGDKYTVAAYYPVEIKDNDGDEKNTINDILIGLHNNLFTGGSAAGYATDTGDYGLYITELWGNTEDNSSGNFGYYLNNKMAMGLTVPVKNGDTLNAYVFKEAFDSSDLNKKLDTFTYFNYAEVEIAPNTEFDLIAETDNFVAGAAYLANEKIYSIKTNRNSFDLEDTSFTTNEKGLAKVKFANEGTYYLTIYSDPANLLIPNVCKVTVKAGAKTVFKDAGDPYAYTLNTAAPTTDVKTSTDALYKHLDEKFAQKPVIGNEKYLFPLIRAGKPIDDNFKQAYVKELLNKVDPKKPISKDVSLEYICYTLTAMGINPTNVYGKNYLEPYMNMKNIKDIPYISTAAYALMAIDACDYWDDLKALGGDITEEAAIEYVLSKALYSGGWSGFDPTALDVDTTAMVLQFLAPYYKTNEKVKLAVDNALAELSRIQKSNGSFVSWGSENACSMAQAVLALSTLGIDADTDARFVKENGSLMDAFLRGYQESDKFETYPGDDFTNQQAMLALVAYNRMKNNQKAIFDMTDITPKALVEPKEEVANTADTTEVALTAITLLSSTIGLAYVLKKKEND